MWVRRPFGIKERVISISIVFGIAFVTKGTVYYELTVKEFPWCNGSERVHLEVVNIFVIYFHSSHYSPANWPFNSSIASSGCTGCALLCTSSYHSPAFSFSTGASSGTCDKNYTSKNSYWVVRLERLRELFVRLRHPHSTRFNRI